MKKLHISKDIALPLDTATQTIAILARKRVGKTYTASVMAEELIKAEIPLVVFDPTGAWWGLRASADGKREGFPVVIIGGEHADVPLEDSAGKVIADLVVERPGYYVIDFSKFEHDTQIVKFATDFGKRFYFRKEQARFPIQLIIDEADIVLPQKPRDNETTMLHTYDGIVRRGGIRGIGVTLITQRPAVLNKNVLTQCETLIALQISGSQDIDAIEHWTRIHGSDAERKELLGSLATLQRGEAWIWSPSWLQVFKRVQIRERETFNSSATPKAGESVIVPTKLAPVDIAKLGEQIKATVERAKANDPAELKKEIQRLKRDLDAKPKASLAAPLPAKEIRVVTDEDLILMRDVIGRMKVIEDGIASLDKFRSDVHAIASRLQAIKTNKPEPQRVWKRDTQFDKPVRSVTPARHAESNGHAPSLGRCERAILTALAQYPNGRTVQQVAVLTGYSGNSGGFNNSLGKLRSSEYITRSQPMQITDAGLEALGEWTPLPSGEGLQAHWLNQLGKCERSILETVLSVYPEGMTAQELGERTGYSANSGGFNNSLGRLRTLELITRGQPIKASDHFFQEA